MGTNTFVTYVMLTNQKPLYYFIFNSTSILWEDTVSILHKVSIFPALIYQKHCPSIVGEWLTSETCKLNFSVLVIFLAYNILFINEYELNFNKSMMIYNSSLEKNIVHIEIKIKIQKKNHHMWCWHFNICDDNICDAGHK